MITRFAIKNNVLTLSILVVLVLSGIMVFNTMPRDRNRTRLIPNARFHACPTSHYGSANRPSIRAVKGRVG